MNAGCVESGPYIQTQRKDPTMQSETIQSIVRQTYGAIARQGATCGCSPTCCTPAANAHPQITDVDAIAHGLGYSATETIVVPEGSNLGLGCGNPQSIAALKQGEDWKDLPRRNWRSAWEFRCPERSRACNGDGSS